MFVCFLSQGPKLNHVLFDVPPEILDLVASHVWKKEHLMQLALTHPLLCDIVIPRHLYRQIRVRLPDPGPWSHLLADLQRLRSIRSLCIIPTTSWHVPGRLVLTKGRESLFKAIAEMQGSNGSLCLTSPIQPCTKPKHLTECSGRQ